MKDIKTVVFLTGFTLFIQSFSKANIQVRANSQEIEPLRSLLSYVLKNHDKLKQRRHSPPKYKLFTKDDNDDSLDIKDNGTKNNRKVLINELHDKEITKHKEKRKNKVARNKNSRHVRVNKDFKEMREVEENKDNAENREGREHKVDRLNKEGRENTKIKENREGRRNIMVRDDREVITHHERGNNRDGKETENSEHNKNDARDNKNTREVKENEFVLKRRDVKRNQEAVDREFENNKEKNNGEFPDYRAFRVIKEKVKEKQKNKRKKLWHKKIEKRPPHTDSKEKELKEKKPKQKIDNIVISSEVNDLIAGKDVNITKTIGLEKPVDIIVHIKMNK